MGAIRDFDLQYAGIIGWRGLVLERDYPLRPNVFKAPTSASDPGYTALKPGEEIEITTGLPFPKNANVEDIRAKLSISQEMPTDIPERATVSVNKKDATKETYDLEISSSNRPINVKIRLDRGEIFWAYSGKLDKSEYDLPNFAQQVNAYLDLVDAAENDTILLRFLVKSDSPGSVKIDIIESSETPKYSLLKTHTWENKLDQTSRSDKSFELDFGTIETVSLGSILDKDTLRGRINKVKLDISGKFSKERLLGTVEIHDGKDFATISGEYSVAQSIKLKEPLEDVNCTGVCGFFKSMVETELYVEIQTDENGFPFNGSPIAKSKMALKPIKDEDLGYWAYSIFESPVNLKANESYWIVIRGIRGAALLGLQNQEGDYLKNLFINRGGQLWKEISKQSYPALLRIVYLPEIDSQMAAIEISVKGTLTKPERVDPISAPQTLSLDVNKEAIENEPNIIVIKSNAQGTLSLVNIIQDYSLK